MLEAHLKEIEESLNINLQKAEREFLSKKSFSVEEGKKWLLDHRAKRREWNKAYWRRNKERINAKRSKKKQFKRECPMCGKSFITTVYNKKYCSVKCSYTRYIRERAHIRLVKAKGLRSGLRKVAKKVGVPYDYYEEQFIKENLGKMTYKDMAIELGRPYSGVAFKARQIKADIEIQKEYGKVML